MELGDTEGAGLERKAEGTVCGQAQAMIVH